MNLENEKKVAQQIRSQYEAKTEKAAKLAQLQQLDKKVRLPAEIFAYTFGVAGSLVLGVGMCLAMKVIANLMPVGIVIGCVGIVMVSVNYFIYKAILKSRKNKYAKQVMLLSDELL